MQSRDIYDLCDILGMTVSYDKRNFTGTVKGVCDIELSNVPLKLTCKIICGVEQESRFGLFLVLSKDLYIFVCKDTLRGRIVLYLIDSKKVTDKFLVSKSSVDKTLERMQPGIIDTYTLLNTGWVIDASNLDEVESV